MRKAVARSLERFMQVWFLFGSSPESLLWLEKRAAKLWGVQQHLSSEPPCQAEELWGTGSLPGDAGLVVFVTLPQWHWCLLMLPSSCTKKSCKTFQLITEVIKHSSPSSGCVPSGSPAGEMLFFLIQPTQTHPYSFHRAGLAARSFGLRFLQRIGGRRAARWTGSSQPVRVLAALSFLGAVQARDLSHKAEISFFSFWQLPPFGLILAHQPPLCRLNNPNSFDLSSQAISFPLLQ